MIYENPTIEVTEGNQPPFITNLIDEDEEVISLEYNGDGLVIVKAWNKASSPCVPIVKLINTLLELNEQGMKNE